METQKIDLHSDTESEVDRGEIRGNIVWKGSQYPIFEGENIIGREDDCDVTIEHDSVSLKHAVLDFEDGVARMRDLKSKNGTSLESSAGSGNYIKLGPTRRNEEVKTGCKIRFGLVDCKYIEVDRPLQESEPPQKAALKYDCETQFINLAAPESDDEEEDGEDRTQALLNKSTSGNSAYDHSYDRPPAGRNPFSASGSVGSTRSVALEMETQLDQDLNSAEKALVHNANTPSSIFSSRLVQGIASGVTASPAANSVMSTPIAINLPTAPSTGHSTRNSSTSTTPSAPVAVPLAAFAERNISPATANGDDECSTEDDGFADESDDHVPIDIPIPAFHPVGIAQEPLSDDSDEESDMSQDLMQVEEDNAEEDVENAVEPAATLSRPATPLALPSPSATAPRAPSAAASAVDIKPQEDIATDDEGEDNASVDFKLAQDDRHPDELTARHNAQREPLSRHASLTASTYAVASSDSPFHNLASTDSRLDAPMIDDGQSNVHNEYALPAAGNASHILPDANTEPQEFFTAQDPPPSLAVPDAFTPNASSASPTIDGSERERAGDVRTAIRSPGAAIRDLLSTSGIPAGVKVFESQGGLVEEVKHSASPAMSSAVSESLPPDAPSMRFDFAAVNKGGATSSAVVPTATTLAHVVEKDAAELDPEVEKLLQKSAAAKPKPVRGKKRIFDEDSEEEFDEPLRAPSSTISSSAVTSATAIASSEVNLVKSASKRSRTNPHIETEEPASMSAAKKANASSSSAPSTAKKAIAGRSKKTSSPLAVIEEADEQDACESVPGQTHREEPAPVSTKKQPAAKKGRAKSSSSIALTTDEPDNVVPPVEAVQATSEKTPAKRGRGKALPAESVAQEEEQPASDDTVAQMAVVEEEVVSEAPKTASKRGRGRVVETEAVAVEPAPVPVAVPEMEAEKPEPTVTKTPARRGKGKTTSFAEDVVAVTEEPKPVSPLVSAQPAAKRGRGKAAPVELPTHAESHPYVPEVPAVSKARGKANASKQPTDEAEADEDEAASLPSKTTKKGLKRSATASADDSVEAAATSVDSADEEIRILFTKVDDAPYLKFIKTLPRASVTSDATIATHCVTLAELKRTPKLMVALNCGVKYVVTEQWMKDCVKAKALVDVVTEGGAAPAKKSKKSDTAVVQDPRADAGLSQQLLASPYIVKDAEKEKLWGFSMATTLSIPRNVPTATQLFDKMSFFCTKGVCGETAPPADELRAIIESGGGHWLASLDEWGQHASGSAKSAKAKPAATGDSATDGEVHTLVVISHPTVVKKEVTKKVNEAISKGDFATSGVYSIELVFLACLKQRVEFDAHRLK